jgi:hypothetical protein
MRGGLQAAFERICIFVVDEDIEATVELLQEAKTAPSVMGLISPNRVDMCTQNLGALIGTATSKRKSEPIGWSRVQDRREQHRKHVRFDTGDECVHGAGACKPDLDSELDPGLGLHSSRKRMRASSPAR